jgi:hypothetical protein
MKSDGDENHRRQSHGARLHHRRRAKRKMGIVAFKQTGKLEGRWFWALAQHAPSKETKEQEE